MGADGFRAGVLQHLEPLGPELEKTLSRLIQYPFVPEVEELAFEVFSDGFTGGFPVRVFFLDADGQEYFIVKDGSAEYPCDVDPDLLDIPHVFPAEWKETFTEQDEDLDTFGLATSVLIPWFAERWKAAGGCGFSRSAYISVHDHDGAFDLVQQKWKT
jgi:hypothetical protein